MIEDQGVPRKAHTECASRTYNDEIRLLRPIPTGQIEIGPSASLQPRTTWSLTLPAQNRLLPLRGRSRTCAYHLEPISICLSDLALCDSLYIYPKTGRPDRDVIVKGWNEIPGARGCTPESCQFRDHYKELLNLGVNQVFGLSVQSSDYQREARDRLELPFELLSDENFTLSRRLGLPGFEVDGEFFLKRLTLVLLDGQIEHVFYPVFPPDEHPKEVIEWLKT